MGDYDYTKPAETPRTTFNGYAGLQHGGIYGGARTSFGTSGVVLGAQVERNGNYLNAEVGAGQAFTGKIEAGHNYDIGHNMGLTLSANAMAAKSNSKTEVRTGDISISSPYADVHSSTSMKWSPTEMRAGLGAQFTYQPLKNVKLGAGVEAGVRRNCSNEVRTELEVQADGLSGQGTIQMEKGNTRAYITPTFKAAIGFGKKQKIALTADASLVQGNIGVKYNF